MIVENKNGITVQELRDYLNKLEPHTKDGSEAFTIWVGDGKGNSNECVAIHPLGMIDENRHDVLLEIRDRRNT